MRKISLWSFFYALALCCSGAQAQALPAVELSSLTWVELKERMGAGVDTVIIPTGGTEQNGPHLVLGKHNAIVGHNAPEIARQVGKTVVAPVLAYVPEGAISPPEGHMTFPGTISVREETFAAVLEDTARSFKQHGFKLICLLSDHGGSVKPQEAVAARLSEEWSGEGVRVLSLSAYYLANGQEEWVRTLGKNIEKPSAHAGFADTSELLALWPEGVRREHIKPFREADFSATGVLGDPSQSSAEYGKKLLEMKIDAAVRQIQRYRAEKNKGTK